MKMKNIITILILSIPLVGCNAVRKVFPQYEKDKAAPEVAALPDDYTVTGVTATDYQLIAPVRVVNSAIAVKVKRVGEDWHQCDKFEIALSTRGTGGGAVRFQWQSVIVNGIARPVAPAGTQYEIRSVVKSTEHSLY